MKKKPYVNITQKHWHLFWATDYLKWTKPKWEAVLSWENPNFKLVLENMDIYVVLRTKEDLACYQPSVQKPASLMVWRAHCAIG